MAAPKKKASAPEFVRWVFETYQDQLHLPEIEGSRKYHRFLDTMNVDSILLSGAARAQSFHVMKFGYPMRRAGYTVAVCSVHANIPGSPNGPKEAHFAYVYWARDTLARGEPPEYICLSPTYESRDGEYRNRFLWYQDFIKGYEALSSRLSPIEEHLLQEIDNDQLAIDMYLYPSRQGSTGGDIARLPLKALVAALSVDAYRIKSHTMQVHANPEYSAVMEFIVKSCGPLLDAWDTTFQRKLSVFITGTENEPLLTQCGQKLVPLSVRESLQVEDVTFAPWREIWIGRRATDLIVNGIAPMYPIFNNWSMLSGVDQSLFENEAMREKFERSLRAEQSADSLRVARLGKAAETDYRMGQFDAHIYDAIVYAQDYIQLTDLAICATNEFVGNTVESTPTITRRSENVNPGLLRMYADPAMQARYIFDLCYGAHILHSRGGIVHSDLHRNNMTVFAPHNQFNSVRSGGKITGYTERCLNPVIAYVAGDRGEADTYIFPHDGWYLCLIDFSRGILGPGARAQLEAEHGAAFAAGFYRDQVNRTLRTLHHYIPNFVQEHQEKIKGLLLANFDAMFHVISAIDYLAIGRNYAALLSELKNDKRTAEERQYDRRVLEVAPEGIKIAQRIENLALEHLITQLSSLIAGDRVSTAFAGETIIPEVFADFSYSAWEEGRSAPFRLRDATLTDAYNGAAPMKYSGSDYERFPPWARFDEMVRHLGDFTMKDLASRTDRPFLQSLRMDDYLAVLQEQVRRKIDDQPAVATSSWIVD